jgi:ubiquinone/menaquinone biosynthesis C-methylase UbiE
MSLSEIMALFGAAAPWVVGLVLIFGAGIVAAAFLQGRSISIVPPRIGPDPRQQRAETDPTPAAGDTVADHHCVGRREYTVEHARDFYQEIAESYDLRNSGNLVATHLETVRQLLAIRAERSLLRVLDLGGGTGKQIAIHFFNDPAIEWTHVDFCPKMSSLFRQNLAGTALWQNARVVIDDLTRVPSQLEPASYDVVLLSLVLSSMPSYPDFPAIGRLLQPGGSLVVTDISPQYTRDNPLYEVAVDGALVALRTTPVDPFEVIRQAERAGLRCTGQKTIGDDSTYYYSFITVFSPATTRPIQDHGDTAALPHRS